MYKMKLEIKRFLYKLHCTYKHSVIINSYGRSGSTVLSNSVTESACKKPFLYRKAILRAGKIGTWDLNSAEIKRGFVHKTHDLPPDKILTGDIKYVYIYGDPANSILSLIRLVETGEWSKEKFILHSEHLKSVTSDVYDCVDRDALNMESHLDSWLAEKRFPVAFVRYESLWNNVDKLSDFLDIKIDLPAFRERRGYDHDPSVVTQIRQTYKAMTEKVDSLEDFFITNVS